MGPEHAFRVETLQTIGWSHLAPAPIDLADTVTVFAGGNGSGKTSAMAALAAVLGARRFGSGRTPARYLHRDRHGREVKDAWVLVAASGHALPTGAATLVLHVTAKRRRFALLPGQVLLSGDQQPETWIEHQLRSLPAATWYSPERWLDEVLTPLGINENILKIYELPQGDAHRILEIKDRELLQMLLGWMGFQDALDALDGERARVAEVRLERDQAHAELVRASADRARLATVQSRIEEVQARIAERDQAHHRWQALAASRKGWLLQREQAIAQEIDTLLRQLDQLDETRVQAERALQTRPSRATAAELLCAREVAGAEGRVVADHLGATQSVDALRLCQSALGTRLFAIVCRDELAAQTCWQRARKQHFTGPIAIAPPIPTQVPTVGSLRQIAAATDPTIDAYLQAVGDVTIALGSDRVAVGCEWWPVLEEPIAGATDDSPPVADVGALSATLEKIADTRGALDRLRREQRELAQELATLSGVDAVASTDDVASPAQVQEAAIVHAAAMRALERLGTLDDLQSEEAQLAAVAERYRRAEEQLGDHETTLERVLAALESAETLWRAELQTILERLHTRFVALGSAADMPTKLVLETAPDGSPRVDVLAAAGHGRPLRSVRRDPDLSGGWRAKTALLLVLAALTMNGGGIVLLDEPASAMDEERLNELGETLARIARFDGTQIVVALPTKRATERLEWCDVQVCFLAPESGHDWAGPPLFIERAKAA